MKALLTEQHSPREADGEEKDKGPLLYEDVVVEVEEAKRDDEKGSEEEAQG